MLIFFTLLGNHFSDELLILKVSSLALIVYQERYNSYNQCGAKQVLRECTNEKR
jgi:hypothetical protein